MFAGSQVGRRVVSTIDGRVVSLRPATMADRRTIYDWSHASDVARFLYPGGPAGDPFNVWCADWKDHYFTGEAPRLGRVFVVLHEDVPVGMVAYNDILPGGRVELDIWMSCEAHCGRGFGPDAIRALCAYLAAEFGVRTFMMQPSAGNPRAVRAYEKAGFVRTPATLEQIRAEWGGVDAPDSVMMIRTENEPPAS